MVLLAVAVKLALECSEFGGVLATATFLAALHHNKTPSDWISLYSDLMRLREADCMRNCCAVRRAHTQCACLSTEQQQHQQQQQSSSSNSPADCNGLLQSLLKCQWSQRSVLCGAAGV